MWRSFLFWWSRKKIRKNYWLVAFDNHWSCGCWLSLCGITKCLNFHQNLRAALCAASDFEPSAWEALSVRQSGKEFITSTGTYYEPKRKKLLHWESQSYRTSAAYRDNQSKTRGEHVQMSKKFHFLTLNQSNAYTLICVFFIYSFITYKIILIILCAIQIFVLSN